MRHDTVRFGQEIGFGDIQKGQTLLLYCTTEKRMYKGEVICAEDGFVECWDEVNKVQFPVLEDDRVWVVRELRIAEVNSLRHSQKPFAIQEDIDNGFLF